jgi:hypothetical protein
MEGPPFFALLSCQASSRFQNALINPIRNVIDPGIFDLSSGRSLVWLFSLGLFALVFVILYYAVPVCTFNSSDGQNKNSSRTVGFAALFYYIIAFFIILATYKGGCIAAYEKNALAHLTSRQLYNEYMSFEK